MFSDPDKSVDSTFAHPGSRATFDWCLPALTMAVSGAGLSLLAVERVISSNPDMAALVQYWLAFVPIHIVAVAASLTVMLGLTLPGQRLVGLNLAPLPRPLGRSLGKAALVVTAFYPASALILLLSIKLLTNFGLQYAPSPIITFLLEEMTVARVLSTVATAVILAPVVEEILFRLVLYEGLKRAGMGMSAVCSALVFAMLHGSLFEVPSLFLLALLLQHLRTRNNSLLPAICAHACFNAISLAFVFIFG
jgi:membrane protease YdiL (CAAX protease family)